MCNMFTAIKRLVDKYEDIQVVYPVHMNPIVRELANDIHLDVGNNSSFFYKWLRRQCKQLL
ncbi:UDP-N-acetylglucosamine 2-epimerase [Neobacillus massiliamazoniensis]|uniref:UDP-N-acetylglucosamine 2-epimerase n=1 Tax=Neobacillus massiliamazoniensis TaxID=1499688 RepID=A0A0U1NTT1_9BACI|nr:UDP-N-acetylglucosamine 2-epimerase [Neobacillus massiliamazoniensis]